MITARPHDLLRLRGSAALSTDAPAWAVDALAIAPWVVVRRGPSSEGMFPVGVRGTTRSERWGTRVHADDVREAVAPEALAHAASPCHDLPALQTLSTVAPLLDATGLGWGPTGSVGFELATGHSTVTPESDLDLLVRAGVGADALPLLTKLHQAFGALAARVDCQVEICSGAVALAELVGSQPEMMLRTDQGPRLVARAAVS